MVHKLNLTLLGSLAARTVVCRRNEWWSVILIRWIESHCIASHWMYCCEHWANNRQPQILVIYNPEVSIPSDVINSGNLASRCKPFLSKEMPFSDINIYTDDGKIFKINKFTLAAGSPFFSALFQHNSFVFWLFLSYFLIKMSSLPKNKKCEKQKEINWQHQRDNKKRKVDTSRKMQQQKILVWNDILWM